MSQTALITDKPWLKGLALASVAALTFTACGDSSEEDDDGGEAESESEVETDDSVDAEVETISEGTLQICSDVPYPPFEYYGADGNVVGFDIDVGAAIAAALDVEPEIIQSSWDGLQSGVALNAEDCDLTISGMTIDRKSTRLNSSHVAISYAVFCF